MAFSGKRPSISYNPGQNDVQEPEEAGSEYEEDTEDEDLDDDALPETPDSDQREEAQEQPSSSTTVTRKRRAVKVPRPTPYEIETDEDGIEWFCEEGNRQSKSGTFTDFTIPYTYFC